MSSTDCYYDSNQCLVCPEITPSPGSPGYVEQQPIIGWNAGANSIDQLDGSMHIVFGMPVNQRGVVVGFKSGRAHPTIVSQIEHGFYFQRSGAFDFVRIIENGLTMGTPMTYVATDTFEIRRVEGVVYYFHNDRTIPVYTSSVPSAGPKVVNACLYASGDSAPGGAGAPTPTPTPAPTPSPANFYGLYNDVVLGDNGTLGTSSVLTFELTRAVIGGTIPAYWEVSPASGQVVACALYDNQVGDINAQLSSNKLGLALISNSTGDPNTGTVITSDSTAPVPFIVNISIGTAATYFLAVTNIGSETFYNVGLGVEMGPTGEFFGFMQRGQTIAINSLDTTGNSTFNHDPYYVVDVPTGATLLQVTLLDNTAHEFASFTGWLIVGFGSRMSSNTPNTTPGYHDAEASPFQVTLTNPTPGRYYVALDVYKPSGTISGMSLTAVVTY